MSHSALSDTVDTIDIMILKLIIIMILILMVNTSNSMTSCTLRLLMYSHHGRVLTDDVFWVFMFSLDGK